MKTVSRLSAYSFTIEEVCPNFVEQRPYGKYQACVLVELIVAFDELDDAIARFLD